MKDFFDLNKRVRKGRNNGGKTVVLNGGLPELFPESGEHLEWDPAILEDIEALDRIALVHQGLMYCGTFLGVLLSTAVSHFRSGNVDLTLTLGEVTASAVVAFVIIPLVYEKLSLNPKAPFIVQFGLFVQNGVFWHVLIDSIGSTL